MSRTPVPLGDRLLVFQEEAADTTEGGLALPDNAREAPTTYHVLAVGPDVKAIQAGDEIIFQGFTGFRFPLAGKELMTVREIDVDVVLREVADGM